MHELMFQAGVKGMSSIRSLIPYYINRIIIVVVSVYRQGISVVKQCQIFLLHCL